MKIPGFNDHATFDTVLTAQKKTEILEEAKIRASGSEDSKKWLPHYQGAKKAVKEILTDEERRMIEEEVEEWNTKGVPGEVQAK